LFGSVQQTKLDICQLFGACKKNLNIAFRRAY